MAITQISKIEVRTGEFDNLPQLSPGEFGYAVDARRLYIGNQPVIGVSPTPDNTEILTELSNLPGSGANGEFQFNSAGIIAGTPGVTYNSTTEVMNIANVVVSNAITLPSNIISNSTALTATDINIAFKLPINIGGTTYYICLTQGQ